MSGLGDRPAFPLPVTGNYESGLYTTIEVSPGWAANGGMTYREWAAAHCMAALLSDSTIYEASAAAKLAVRATDALIAALEGTPASSGEPPATGKEVQP